MNESKEDPKGCMALTFFHKTQENPRDRDYSRYNEEKRSMDEAFIWVCVWTIYFTLHHVPCTVHQTFDSLINEMKMCIAVFPLFSNNYNCRVLGFRWTIVEGRYIRHITMRGIRDDIKPRTRSSQTIMNPARK